MHSNISIPRRLVALARLTGQVARGNPGGILKGKIGPRAGLGYGFWTRLTRKLRSELALALHHVVFRSHRLSGPVQQQQLEHAGTGSVHCRSQKCSRTRAGGEAHQQGAGQYSVRLLRSWGFLGLILILGASRQKFKGARVVSRSGRPNLTLTLRCRWQSERVSQEEIRLQSG